MVNLREREQWTGESPHLSTWSGPWSPAATAPNPGTASATHAGAAHEHDEEGFQDAGHAHNPRQAQEEDHAEDVLQAGQVDADEGAHAWVLRERTVVPGRPTSAPSSGTPPLGALATPSGPERSQEHKKRNR